VRKIPLRAILLLVLLAIGFGLSAWRIASPWWNEKQHGITTIRFSHWQLEPGVRRAYEAIIADYEALHPEIRVKQIAIPGRIYRQWGSTQLVGGQPPDLMQIGLGLSRGFFFDDFVPITSYVDEPNPYNAGGPLADTPWRNTFHDGMFGSMDPKTMEYFGASQFSSTVRIFCNQDMLKKVTGKDTFPENFADFLKLRDQLQAYNAEHNTPISLIAGSKFSAMILFRNLFSTQTQKIGSRLNHLNDFPLKGEYFYLAYLDGDWDMSDPSMQQGARLLTEASTLMSSGFAQAEGDQAHLRFVQSHAMLMVLGSLQATGIIEGSPFEVSVHRIPQPQTDDPEYGPQMRGPIAETDLITYGALGITRSSRHPEQALDFLRYLTSQEVCRKFSQISRNLPTTIGIEPAEEMKPFLPEMRGFPPGPIFTTISEVITLVEQNRHLLAAPVSSPEQYLAALEAGLPKAMITDLQRIVRSRYSAVRLVEASIGASAHLAADHHEDAVIRTKLAGQLGAQNDIEASAYYTRLRLKRADRTAP